MSTTSPSNRESKPEHGVRREFSIQYYFQSPLMDVHLTRQGLALPVKVLALVATYLARSSSLRTLADLNESSRCLHQESQRILHETMTIEEVYTWDRCIKSGSLPSGWKYIK